MQLAARLAPLESVGEPLPELLGRVADAGFEGVVLVGLEAAQLAPLAEAIGQTGLEPVAAHVSHDRLQAAPTEVVRELRTVGCERVVVPGLHEAHFEAVEEVARMAVRLSALGGRLAADGRTLCYHNRDHEFEAVGERSGYDVLVDRSGEGLRFEFDAGRAAAADHDPVAVLERIDGRVPLVDVTPVDPERGRLGPTEGSFDPTLLAGAAAAAGTDWLVHVADDRTHHDGDLREAVDALAPLVE